MGNSSSRRSALEEELQELRQGFRDEELGALRDVLAEGASDRSASGAAESPSAVGTCDLQKRISLAHVTKLLTVEEFPRASEALRDSFVEMAAGFGDKISGEGVRSGNLFQVAKIMSCGNSKYLSRVLRKCIEAGGASSRERCVELCYRLAIPEDVASELDFSIFRLEDESPTNFVEWMSTNMPGLRLSLKNFTRFRLLRNPWEILPCKIGKLDCPSDFLQDNHLFALSMSSFALQTGWTRLYSSANSGNNFENFCDAIISYEGTTVIAVLDTSGAIFGCVATDPWMFKEEFYGSSSCYLFSVAPIFRVNRPMARTNGNFMWLNSAKHRPNLPAGLGMGGEADYFRLLLAPNFRSCTNRSSGLTFNEGRVASSETFDCAMVEVWGCGGDEALRGVYERRNAEQRFRDQRRKVDKKQLMDGFTQEHLLGNTFKHRQQQRTRGGERS